MAVDPNAIWAQAQLDPSYLAAHGSNAAALKALILGYGSTSALSPQLAGQYGINPGDVSAADQNPYSVQAQLKKSLGGAEYNTTNTAEAHGALFSGAHEAAQLGNIATGAQNNYNAQQALQNSIAGINASDVNALTGAYGTLTTNALNTPQPAPQQTQTAPGLPAPAPVGSTPATQTWAANPSGFDAGTPHNQALAAIKPPKPPALPKLTTGYLGHA